MSTTVPDTTGTRRVLNWEPSPEDSRDYKFAQHMPFAAKLAEDPLRLPEFVDLDPGFPNPLTDQGPTGECTAHASLNDMEFILKLLGFKTPLLSHKAQYYLTRLEGGFPATQDTGAYNRDTVKVLARVGAVRAEMHPNSTPFTTPPTTLALADANKRLALKYVSIPVDVNAIKASIASGYPVIIGFRVPQAFMTTGTDGLVSSNMSLIPNAGHAVILTGYDDQPGSPTFGRFKIRNSWGTGWGANGRGWVLYAWLTTLGADFWAITDAKGEKVAEPVTPPPSPVPVPTVTSLWMDINPKPTVTVGSPVGSESRVYVTDAKGQRVMQQGVKVTQTLWGGTATRYNNVTMAETDNEGFAAFPGYTFNNPHPLSEDFHYEYEAGTLSKCRSLRFEVVKAPVPVPPVPPTPTPQRKAVRITYDDGSYQTI